METINTVVSGNLQEKFFRKSKYSKLSVLLFVVIFASLGAYLILNSFAATGDTAVATIEAETFTLPIGASVYPDTAASAGHAALLPTNGTATKTGVTPAATRLEVWAKGDACKGAPKMEVWIDNVRKISSTVTQSWAGYSVTQNLTASSHTIAIKFTNDTTSSACSRSLQLDKVVLYSTVTDPAPSGTNLALNKPVTSNASYIDPIARINDGDINTANYTNIEAGPRWVQIDLGASQGLSQIKLWHYFGDARKYHDVVVQVSDDPKFLSNVTTLFNNDQDNTAGQGIGKDAEYAESATGESIPTTAIARYVRLWSNGSTVNGSNHYVEVQVFGNASSPAPAPSITSFTPSPATVASGASSSLSWATTNADSCNMTGGVFSGSQPANSTGTSTGALNATTTYTLSCTSSGGTTTKSTTVTVGGGGIATCPTTPTTPPTTGKSVIRQPVVAYDPVHPEAYSPSIMSDAEAAAHVHSAVETRGRTNQIPNHTVPTSDQLTLFHADQAKIDATNINPLAQQVTGCFTGTTDEIIQWASWKWGINEDIMRAAAVNESWWKQAGSIHQDGTYYSYGILQVLNKWVDTYPMSDQSTAFNADFYGASYRFVYDGLNKYFAQPPYAAGDEWGSVGAWFSGAWWDPGATTYIDQVKTILSNRTWEQPSFTCSTCY